MILLNFRNDGSRVAAVLALALVGCGVPANECKDGACVFSAGSSDDPVIAMAQKQQPLSVSCTANATAATLHEDNFSAGANDDTWPSNVGYAGDFNAEWVTDGVSARPINPTWPEAHPGAPSLPLITGFVKFVDVCPNVGAKLSIYADVDTHLYTADGSDTTLVVYYFDASNAVLRIDTSYPLLRGNVRRTALYDATFPAGTRRVALAPMALLSAKEQQTVHYRYLRADYEPNGYLKTTSIADVNFSDTKTTPFGLRQASGWSDYGGDWYVNGKPTDYITFWNPVFGGAAPKSAAYEVGTYATFQMQDYPATAVFSATVFASGTFTSVDSFSLLRATFLNSSGAVLGVVDSDRLSYKAYGNLDIRRSPMPAGVKTVKIAIVNVLGALEASSMYADNLHVWTFAP